MKITNANQPGERNHGVVRGHIGALRAGSTGIAVKDATGTEVIAATELQISGAIVGDAGDGVATLTIEDAATAPSPVGPLTALRHFYAALQSVSTSPVDIVVVGDSVAVGEAATTSAGRYVEILAGQLADRFTTSPAAIYYPALSTATFSLSPWTITGASLNTVYGLGRYANALGAGDTMTIGFTGSAFKIFWTRQATGGTFAYAVDAGAATNVDTSGAEASGQATTVTGLSDSAHTITITRISGTSLVEGFIGFRGTASSGVRMWPGGHSGYEMGDFVDGSNPRWIDVITAIQPSLVIISLGINDSAAPVDPATYKANLVELVSDIRGACTLRPSILVLSQYKVDGVDTWEEYQAAQQEAVIEDGDLAILDLTGVFGVDETEAEDYGLLDADLVHPSDAGHRLIADLLADTIVPNHVDTGDAVADALDSLSDAVDALEEDVAEAAETSFLLTVDPGTPSYDDSGDDVVVTWASVWGYDADGPYYDSGGATSGEEGLLCIDSRDGQLVVVPYAP